MTVNAALDVTNDDGEPIGLPHESQIMKSIGARICKKRVGFGGQFGQLPGLEALAHVRLRVV